MLGPPVVGLEEEQLPTVMLDVVEDGLLARIRVEDPGIDRGIRSNLAASISQGYFGFIRPGNYHVVTVDLRPRLPFVSVKLPDPPERLGLGNPYPDLEQTWDGDHRQWGWSVPNAASVPDLGLAVDFSSPHQPESGPKRPSGAVP